MDRHDWGAQTCNPVQEACDPRRGAAIRRGEDLGRVSVQDAVHDVLEEGFERGHGYLMVRASGGGEEEKEHAGEEGGNAHGAFTPKPLDVDRVAGDDAAGNSDDGGDGVIAVNNAGVGWLLST